MTKKFTLLTFLLCIFSFSAMAQTVLQGTVVEKDGEPIIGATVILFKNEVQVKGAATDFDGNYILPNIDPGTYSVEVAYIGLATQRINGVVISENSTTKLNFELEQSTNVIDEVVIKEYKVPLVSFDQTSSVKTITAEKIMSSPLKSVQGLAATSGGLSSDANGNISIRGARANATNYYVDGIRVSGAGLIPASEIEQLQVITGGLAAKYGDVTGGVISLTSRGPSERFSGGFEAETSQFLDPYGYNFLNGNISGPIIKKDGKSIVGFRLNAQYITQVDDGPSAFGVYRMPAEIIADLEETPNFQIDGVDFPRAELLGRETLNAPLKTRPNEDRWDLDITGKLDARLSQNIDVSFSGVYGQDQNRFTPGGGWGLLNWTHNPYTYGNNYRVNGRWRHKIGKQGLPEDKDEIKGTVLRNASYILQVGVENRNAYTEDFTHEDRLFDYGLYGSQEINAAPSVGFIDTSEWGGSGAIQIDAVRWIDHVTFSQDESDFSPFIDPENGIASPNPVLSKYQTINGRLIGTSIDVWGPSFFDNVGRVYNNTNKFNNDRYTVNFDAQLDLLPSGSIKQRHNIQFGGMYELRNNSFWTINPRELWNMARDAANAHFLAGVDTTTFTGNVFFPQTPFPMIEFQEYGRNIEEDSEKKFYTAIREKYGLTINDFVNVNSSQITKDGLSLDMFSASELINWQDLGLNYYGYDYLGNRVSGGSFDDFFKQRDPVTGRRTYPVAAVNPVYLSGYIQDKFTYEDIILRVGVRADYFDANTKVLRDKYSLYTIESAEEFSNRRDESFPTSVDPASKVYLVGDDRDQSAVKAYRLGDDWFAPDGTKTDPQLLFGTDPVNPSYLYTTEENNIKDENFDPNQSFADYIPSLKITPRISLSFPISEDAGFFAHYDQLVQRPPSNTTFTALDYFFFEDIGRLNGGGAANNPNLRPETTIDYEVGFQQKLTQSSAIKLSAYYKENRDLIQTRYLLNVPIVNDYLTYDNIDFGTVKGFTATYDLRRTGNIEMSASYTLQYAEGNTGLNLQVAAISGRPFTKLAFIDSPFGGSGFTGEINGARLPWNFNVDARLDRNFNIKMSKEAKRGLNLNVYMRVSNLFDTRNVVGVYRVTGSPDDDGFLSSEFGADAVKSIEESGKDVQSYLAAYEWAILNPGFYSLPRRIRVGGIINF